MMQSWVTATIGATPYCVEVKAAGHELVADETPGNGGRDAGPTPFCLLLASLGACTAITLKKHAETAGWAMEALEVDLRVSERAGVPHIERILSVVGELTQAQRNDMLKAADETPVTQMLKSGMRIRTELA